MSVKDIDLLYKDIEELTEEELEKCKEIEKKELKPEWDLIKAIHKGVLYVVMGLLIFILVYATIQSLFL